MSETQYLTGACEQCGGHMQFPAEGLGLEVACPHCGKPTNLSEDLGRTDTPEGALTGAELRAAFTGPIRKKRVGLAYQLALLLTTCFMLVLPLAYLGVIAVLAYGVYWYALVGRGLFGELSGGFYVLFFKILLYAGPLLGGGIAVLFMLKPLFAPRLPRSQALALDPTANPLLYEFIFRICTLVGAPLPSRIRLDCDLNASASFRRGWLSLFGNDLVLTIGLPLAAGLSARQLAAVVAHEFGHFNQPVAMRLSYIVAHIDHWFARVVYQRDAWDAALDEWADAVEDWRLALFVGCIRLAVGLSRLILKLLMWAGRIATCALARQMEHHADQSAIAVAGSAAQESVELRLRELALLHGLAYDGLQKSWVRRRQLPLDLPSFFTHLEPKLPAGFREQARNTLLNETAGLFATHPTPAQRIQRARRAAEPGVLELDVPASHLFGDFELLSRMVTHSFYRDELRLPVLPSMLKPVHDFIAE